MTRLTVSMMRNLYFQGAIARIEAVFFGIDRHDGFGSQYLTSSGASLVALRLINGQFAWTELNELSIDINIRCEVHSMRFIDIRMFSRRTLYTVNPRHSRRLNRQQ